MSKISVFAKIGLVILVCAAVFALLDFFVFKRFIFKSYLENYTYQHEIFEFDCQKDSDCYIVNKDLKLDCRYYDCGLEQGCFDSGNPDYLSINFLKFTEKLKELCNTPERRGDMKSNPSGYACELGLPYCPNSDTTYHPACYRGRCVKVKGGAQSDSKFPNQFMKSVPKD